MKIQDLLNSAKKDKKLLEAEVLIAFVLGVTRESVVANNDREVDSDDVRKFHSFWVRLINGEPLAYLINEKEFYGLSFYVDKNVLVPRPETEFLVQKVLDLSQKSDLANKKSVQVVDVGTGSGAIAVALAKNGSNLVVSAGDVSPEACRIASENAKRLGANVSVSCGDLLEPFKDRQFDIIVANLPYIGTEKYNFISKEVADHEPAVALYGGEDGLRLYEKMFRQILDYGLKPSYILGEFGFLQASDISEMISKCFPRAKLNIEKDLAGLDRDFVLEF